ncbi:hypothetical protein N836_03075 [Leptolyngbya sp. Heron Island J]|nr:hypothetical protein N836_03075 [Leptolyngbya sp. Heron Island J]
MTYPDDHVTQVSAEQAVAIATKFVAQVKLLLQEDA